MIHILSENVGNVIKCTTIRKCPNLTTLIYLYVIYQITIRGKLQLHNFKFNFVCQNFVISHQKVSPNSGLEVSKLKPKYDKVLFKCSN